MRNSMCSGRGEKELGKQYGKKSWFRFVAFKETWNILQPNVPPPQAKPCSPTTTIRLSQKESNKRSSKTHLTQRNYHLNRQSHSLTSAFASLNERQIDFGIETLKMNENEILMQILSEKNEIQTWICLFLTSLKKGSVTLQLHLM